MDEELEYIQAHYDMLELGREVAENETNVAAVTKASTANTRSLGLDDKVKWERHMHTQRGLAVTHVSWCICRVNRDTKAKSHQKIIVMIMRT